MALDSEDMKALEDRFDDRYVLQSDCDSAQRDIGKKFADDDKRIDKLIVRMDLWSKLLWAITSASIGALVLEFFGLVFK
jgi:hypothetical protein